MMSRVDLVENIQKLSWAGRISIVLLLIAAIVNLRNAFEQSIDRPWRRMYLYKGTVCLISLVYYSLLLAEVLDRNDFGVALRWITPLLITGLFTSALLHRWEIGSLREKKHQEERLVAALEEDDEN